MLIATMIFAIVYVLLFQAAMTGHWTARAQPEAADLRQRLRVAVDMMQRDLLMAGAGNAHGADAGPLADIMPGILPMRTGAKLADPELSFFDDRVTVLFVPEGAVAVPLTVDMPAATAGVPIDAAAPGCPGAGVCGFFVGTRALIADLSGPGLGFDLFSVRSVAGALGHGAPDPAFSHAYSSGPARVVPIRQRVYYLDAPTHRLMVYDGSTTDVPLADGIAGLRFQYLIDPWAGGVSRAGSAGGNCLYAAGVPPLPLLTDLGGPRLVAATAALLGNGPPCGLSPNRFDGDLLRIRRVRVTIRAQASDSTLRGSGPDFAVPGTAPGGAREVADAEVTFDVTPRNLQPAR
jgi:hypothetical protein